MKRFARLLKGEKLASKEEQVAVTEVVDMNYQWQMDLADMNKLRGYNRMYRYLLVVVNLYSRFAWVQTVENEIGK